MRQKCWCLVPKGFFGAVSDINFKHETYFESFPHREGAEKQQQQRALSCLTENEADVMKLTKKKLLPKTERDFPDFPHFHRALSLLVFRNRFDIAVPFVAICLPSTKAALEKKTQRKHN